MVLNYYQWRSASMLILFFFFPLYASSPFSTNKSCYPPSHKYKLILTRIMYVYITVSKGLAKVLEGS